MKLMLPRKRWFTPIIKICNNMTFILVLRDSRRPQTNIHTHQNHISIPSFAVPQRQHDPSTPPCDPHQCATFELKFTMFVLGGAEKSLGTSLNTHLKTYTHIRITYPYLALPCLGANTIRAHHRATHTNTAQLLN